MICKSDEDDRKAVVIHPSRSRERESSSTATSPSTQQQPPVKDAEKNRLANLESTYQEMKDEINVLRHLSSNQRQLPLPPQTPIGDFYLSRPTNLREREERGERGERATPMTQQQVTPDNCTSNNNFSAHSTNNKNTGVGEEGNAESQRVSTQLDTVLKG
jgi:hypothetical protein